MTTVREVVENALQNLAVVAVGEAPAAEEAAKGLSEFNAMMHGFKSGGADLGHADLDLADEIPVAPEYIQPITDALMRRLAMPFARRLSANQALAAAQAERTLAAAFSTVPMLTLDPGLTGRGRRGGKDEAF